MHVLLAAADTTAGAAQAAGALAGDPTLKLTAFCGLAVAGLLMVAATALRKKNMGEEALTSPSG
jgi:hypothetical protein